MKITGSNIFSTINQLQSLNEINLKDGQKIIGRIISLSTDEAVLDIAGRPIQAKIEGNPPPAGSTQTFLVNIDEQGRIILKVLPNPTESESHETGSWNKSAKTSLNPEQALIQKNVVSALMKDNLPTTAENVEKVMGFLKDFQNKYQQNLHPKVATFIMAQKWPFTPATVLAAIVYQDKDLRDLLWNKLQDSLPENVAAVFKEKLATAMQAQPQQIQAKLHSLVETKLPGVLDKLAEMVPAKEIKTLSSADHAPQLFMAKAMADLKTKSHETPEKKQSLTTNPAPVDLNSKQPALVNKNSMQNLMLTESKEENPVLSKALQTDKSNEPNQAKISSILDQNISINKAILKDSAVNGSGNLIPLLVSDAQSQIRECFVQWKEEKSANKDNSTDQVVYMTIPTNNMGDIHLALRIGQAGTRIHFRVNSAEIRKYFIQNSNELKEFIAKNDALISVNLKENEEIAQGVNGVDLWM